MEACREAAAAAARAAPGLDELVLPRMAIEGEGLCLLPNSTNRDLGTSEFSGRGGKSAEELLSWSDDGRFAGELEESRGGSTG